MHGSGKRPYREGLQEADIHSKIKSLLFFICLAALVSALGGYFTAPNVEAMYRDIAKPSWAPPGWLFGPVWTFLYLLIALAGWRIWLARKDRDIRVPMALYAGQLLLNALWTLIYFELAMPWPAFAEIALLFGLIAACAAVFWPVSRFAALCMIPYGMWVGFAAALNASIALMNP